MEILVQINNLTKHYGQHKFVNNVNLSVRKGEIYVPKGMAEIREIIVRLNTEKNITFLISSHILGELSKIATSYGIIEKGELKRQILKTELTEDLEEYFLSLTGSTTFTMIAGLLISFKVMNIFYALVEQLTHFNLAQYMLDYDIFQIGIESAEPRAAVVGVIFLLAEIALLCLVMNKKDIR